MKRMIARTIQFMGQGLGVGRAGMRVREITTGDTNVANTFAPLRADCFGHRLYEVLVAVFHPHTQRKSFRRRNRLAQAPRASRPRSQTGRWPLHLHAVWPARTAEDHGALSRGNGQRWRDRTLDAAHTP